MGLQKQHLHNSLLALGTLGFASATLLPLSGQAVDTPSSSPSGGAPSRTASGAPKRTVSTHQCALTSESDLNRDGQQDKLTPVTVLSPQGNVTTTLNPQPTLLVYLPQMRGAQAELLVDERLSNDDPNRSPRYHEVLFVEDLPVPETAAAGPRIAQYQMPAGVLESGKSYAWTLNIFCRNNNAQYLATVEGLISCEAGCAASALGIEQPWNETLLATAQDRATRPEAWQRLLDSQGLGCFKNVPFADEVGVTFTVEDDPQCFVD
ncbi:MAG: DUF928 domain-containing protein [Cyanobacteria bacterium P01_G01_bin.54]